MSKPINQSAQSVEKSILTPICYTINADGSGTDFDQYLNELDPYFEEKEVWCWMVLSDALSDTKSVEVEMIDRMGEIFTTTLILRLASPVLCQGRRILSSTDVDAVLTVGTGQ